MNPMNPVYFWNTPVLSWIGKVRVNHFSLPKVVDMPSKPKPVSNGNITPSYWEAKIFGMTYKNLQVKLTRHGVAKTSSYNYGGYGNVPSSIRTHTREDGRMKIIVSLTGKVGEQQRWLKDGDIIFRGTESVLAKSEWNEISQAVEEARYVLKNLSLRG